jgi:hypothetical protein
VYRSSSGPTKPTIGMQQWCNFPAAISPTSTRWSTDKCRSAIASSNGGCNLKGPIASRRCEAWHIWEHLAARDGNVGSPRLRRSPSGVRCVKRPFGPVSRGFHFECRHLYTERSCGVADDNPGAQPRDGRTPDPSNAVSLQRIAGFSTELKCPRNWRVRARFPRRRSLRSPAPRICTPLAAAEILGK